MHSKGRFIATAALVAGLAAGFAPAASATANVVPNPDFETPPCGFGGPVICGWNDLTGTMAWDQATTPHSGAASMQLTGSAVSSVEATTIGNMCIQIGSGVHLSSFWYRLPPGSPANKVSFGADWYPNSSCSVATSGFDTLATNSPIADGAWHQVTGTLTAPPGTGSGFFAVFAGCAATCSLTANFDDLDFEASPTAVHLLSLGAARTRAGVVVRWRTASEVGAVGFDLYRQTADGRRVRVNPRLVPARGPGGYAYADRRAPRRAALGYWLAEVDAAGHRTWRGVARVGASQR